MHGPQTQTPMTTTAVWSPALITALAPIAWGTTYFVSSELLPVDRPLLAGAMRALPAGLVLALVTRCRPRGVWWTRAAVLGGLNIGAFFALLFIAAFRLPGGVAATLGAIQPLVAAGLAAALVGERFGPRTLASGLLGAAGVGVLVLRADAQLDWLGVAAGLLGATSMAAGVVLSKRWGRPVPLLAFTSWQLIAGGLVLLPLMFVVEGAPPALTAANLAGFAWLAGVGTAFAYVVWFRGIQVLPVARVSILGLLSPVAAAMIGWIVLGQQLSTGQLAGMAIILAAVWLPQLPVVRPLLPGRRSSWLRRASPSVVTEPTPREGAQPGDADQRRATGPVLDDGRIPRVGPVTMPAARR